MLGSKALRCFLLSPLLGCFCVQTVQAVSGPDYLEEDRSNSPLSAGFSNLKLPFVEQRQSSLRLRSYYLNRNHEQTPDQEDWAGGGWLSLESSAWQGRLKLGVTAFTSQKLYADPDKADTGLLQPGHNSYGGISEVRISLNTQKLALQGGRYFVNMPYINKYDTRMIPQSFQGIQGVYRPTNNWSFGVGNITHIKAKTSTGFDPLYSKAGLSEKHSVSVAGSIYRPSAGDLAGFYLINAPEYMNTLYSELSKRFLLDEYSFFELSGQYTHQHSIGKALDGDFDSDHYGAKLIWQNQMLTLSAAYTYYSDTDRMRHPWGSIPGYSSVMVKDFNRPGEKAWLVGGKLKLDRWLWAGIELDAKYIQGETPDRGGNASPDQQEIDLSLTYIPPELPDLSLRLRNAWVQQKNSYLGSEANSFNDLRLIINYTYKI